MDKLQGNEMTEHIEHDMAELEKRLKLRRIDDVLRELEQYIQEVEHDNLNRKIKP